MNVLVDFCKTERFYQAELAVLHFHVLELHQDRVRAFGDVTTASRSAAARGKVGFVRCSDNYPKSPKSSI